MDAVARWRWWATWLVSGSIGFLACFVLAFILVGGVVSIFSEDVDATMDSPRAFAVALTVVFAAAGAGLGSAQYLHLRGRVRHARRWIGLVAGGFALIALTFNAIVLAAGDSHLDVATGRAANEVAHTTAVGLVFAWASWRLVGRPNGAQADRWLILTGLAFPLTGLSVWGLEVALDATGGDVNPLGMLVFGALTGAAFHPLATPRRQAMGASGTPAPG
jgi:hypothetical protein